MTAKEIKINTLEEFSGEGYAKSVTVESIKFILDKGKYPQWSCSSGNIASEKLVYIITQGDLMKDLDSLVYVLVICNHFLYLMKRELSLIMMF